ncbi:catalase family peroxidase [Shewanella chilikensis]|uniref:catalase family peroxidase n=1 Tax=Shewanella chilikensis TaxID=558541 RepID=UPI0030050D86
MRVSVWPALLLLGTQLGVLGSSSVMAAQANDFIQVFEVLSGQHPGERKGHAKGICTIGSFRPSSGEVWLKELPLFATEQALPAQVRFSMAGGDPFVADTSRSPRGVGVRIELPDGQVHQLAGLSTPVFPGKDPDSFLGLLRASLAQREGETGAVARYLQQHPDAARQGLWLKQHNPPAAYTSVSYFGIHSFIFGNQGQQKRFGRWELWPVDGEQPLTDAELAQLPDDFLQDRLMQRLKTGPAQFELKLVLAEEGDPLLDPSQQWPDNRPRVALGRLSIDSVATSACDKLNFDPNVLSKGIAASDDPVLRLRSAAYAISFGKRLSGR